MYLFRRLRPDLLANHLDGETGFRNLLSTFPNVSVLEDEIKFPNGAKIHLCHCQYEKDRFKYQGAEIHVLLIDELTHFTDIIYRFLRNRVRMPPAIPPIIHQIFGSDFTLPKIICGSNPGNVGHTFVKQTFVDMLKPFEIKQMPPEEGGMLRQYIPALLEDNPSLMENDPGYEMRLEGLGSPDLVKAMRYGLWDITAGAALEKLRRDKHMIRDFEVPNAWTKFMVIDWGSSKPFSVGWWTVVDEDMILKAKGEWTEKFIPKGALIRYREYYGWNGKANEGVRLESSIVANNILDMEEEAGEEMDYRVGDAAMWAEHDGPSVQQKMYEATNGRFLMEQSKKGRIGNFEEVRARIAGDEDGPMLYVTESCKHWWRTVPDLQLDERRPELGPDSEQEDHCVTQDTVLFFKDGCAKIGDKIGTTGEIWTPQGWKEYFNCRLTRKDAKVIDVYVGKKKMLTCTPDHKLMTTEGWVEAQDCVGKSLLLSTPKYKCLEEKGIDLIQNIESNGNNARTFKVIRRVLQRYCIERCGNLLKEKFPITSISIIKMEIQKIITSKIWNVLRRGFIIVSTLIIEAKNILINLLRIYANGMKQKGKNLLNLRVYIAEKILLQPSLANYKGVDFVQICAEEEVPRGKAIKGHQYTVKNPLISDVIYVKKRSNLIGDIADFAREDAKEYITVTGVRDAGKANVYCMTVPEMHCFTLENGIVVHNCYDETQYSCASRPYITTYRDRLEAAISEAKRQARKNS